MTRCAAAVNYKSVTYKREIQIKITYKIINTLKNNYLHNTTDSIRSMTKYCVLIPVIQLNTYFIIMEKKAQIKV